MAKCLCEDKFHGVNGCPIDNDGIHGEICQACFTRCHTWNIRNNGKSSCGKCKIVKCKHPEEKINRSESHDFGKMKRTLQEYCKVCCCIINTLEIDL